MFMSEYEFLQEGIEVSEAVRLTYTLSANLFLFAGYSMDICFCEMELKYLKLLN
jgi:hypothetical protein